MNNVEIKLPSGETINVELISYFEVVNISKKYLFYTKNEMVENNLIKMYVAEVLTIDNSIAINEKMSEQEWNDLKNIMKSILLGEKNNNIKYLEIGGA
ncbi:MAG: hypothetical protein PHF21_01315 [Bacilli bacterium]|nr:hypothetical protein [Bacilli bacterium]